MMRPKPKSQRNDQEAAFCGLFSCASSLDAHFLQRQITKGFDVEILLEMIFQMEKFPTLFYNDVF